VPLLRGSESPEAVKCRYEAFEGLWLPKEATVNVIDVVLIPLLKIAKSSRKSLTMPTQALSKAFRHLLGDKSPMSPSFISEVNAHAQLVLDCMTKFPRL